MIEKQEVDHMNLLLSAANVVVNLEILDISKRLLKVNEEHLRLFKEYKEFMENESHV